MPKNRKADESEQDEERQLEEIQIFKTAILIKKKIQPGKCIQMHTIQCDNDDIVDEHEATTNFSSKRQTAAVQ